MKTENQKFAAIYFGAVVAYLIFMAVMMQYAGHLHGFSVRLDAISNSNKDCGTLFSEDIY